MSVLAHLQRGSIRVHVGGAVQQGQVLGLCGNSGSSSEPRLHYHLQSAPVIQDALGIKCYFAQVTVLRDGKGESRAEYAPVKGDVLNVE